MGETVDELKEKLRKYRKSLQILLARQDNLRQNRRNKFSGLVKSDKKNLKFLRKEEASATAQLLKKKHKRWKMCKDTHGPRIFEFDPEYGNARLTSIIKDLKLKAKLCIPSRDTVDRSPK